MNKRDEKLKPYLEALPEIIKYMVITSLILEAWLFLLGRLFRLVLNSTGRVAVTTGDFTFLFTTWQGIAIILLALFSLAVYVAIDLNSKIILSRNLLLGKERTIWQTVQEALKCLPRFINVHGLLIILYIVLIAPILGFGLSVTLTRGFYIPTFISSVIADTPLYLILASVTVIIFIIFGLANLFIMHGIVLDDMSVKDASNQSRKLFKENWKDYVWQNITFIVVMMAVIGIVALIVLVLPLAIVDLLPLSTGLKRGLIIFFMIQGVALSVVTALISTPLYIMKNTQLYYKYKTGTEFSYRGHEIKVQLADKVVLAGLTVAAILLSVFLSRDFDRYFPTDTNVRIIAHRGGGVEGAENTVAGLVEAWKLGAYGSEIDIQRTKDGYYIINHDGNFSRVAGDSRKPEEMTLEEVKKLSVDGEPVPTFEEMLDASKGRLILFVELKGATADLQMCDDAVRIIKERGMEDEAVLISLKYDLIDYIEKTYPEMKTAFLTFASFGDTGKLNCDYLGLEEESATADTISAIHKQGKEVLVWTVNEEKSQVHFMCSEADAIITDCVRQGNKVIEDLAARSDIRRIIDKIKTIIG